jgi:N-acetylneuraminate lyase
MEELLDAASTRLPTLRGLKYTDYNLMELGRCLSGNGGKYQVLYGRDEVRHVHVHVSKVAGGSYYQ